MTQEIPRLAALHAQCAVSTEAEQTHSRQLRADSGLIAAAGFDRALLAARVSAVVLPSAVFSRDNAVS